MSDHNYVTTGYGYCFKCRTMFIDIAGLPPHSCPPQVTCWACPRCGETVCGSGHVCTKRKRPVVVGVDEQD